MTLQLVAGCATWNLEFFASTYSYKPIWDFSIAPAKHPDSSLWDLEFFSCNCTLTNLLFGIFSCWIKFLSNFLRHSPFRSSYSSWIEYSTWYYNTSLMI
jgi:hypothetical protein